MTALPIKVLLVEDNPGDARLLREALAEMGGAQFELTHVNRLGEALKRLGEERFDTILLDLSLPDGQGFDTIARVREGSPGLPIVVLTGLNDEEVAIKAVRAGAQDYLVKGQVDGNLLARAMRYAIERKQVEKQLQLQLQRIYALREINMATTSTLDLHSVLNILMEKIDILLPYTAVQIWLMSQESGQLERAACWNLDEAEWKRRKLKDTPALVKAAIVDKVPVVAHNVQTDSRTLDPEFYRKQGLVSYLGVPLLIKGQVLGVLVFLTREEHRFIDEEIQFLSILAGQAAMAIHNARLHDQAKKQALELEKANRDLEKAGKVKDEFLSFVSHELKTPVNSILGYTEMMQSKMFGEVNLEQERALGKVMANSRDLLNMVNGLLEATKIESGTIQAEIRELNLSNFFEELKSIYDVPLNKELILVWNTSCDLPVVNTDGDKMRHILQNLINNAIKYTDRGKVTVSARYQSEVGSVQFTVNDTGIGIPEEALPFIFEMFRQVSGSATRSCGGVGLGLHIVKKFTELLGGTIEVRSEPNKGSTFTVTIPCELAAQRLAVEAQAVSEGREAREIDWH